MRMTMLTAKEMTRTSLALPRDVRSMVSEKIVNNYQLLIAGFFNELGRRARRSFQGPAFYVKIAAVC